MLIYARIVMIMLLIVSVLGLLSGLTNLGAGQITSALVSFIWFGFWAWVAWGSWEDMSKCVDAAQGSHNF